MVATVVSAANPKGSKGDFVPAPRRSKRALSDYSAEVGQRIVDARKELGLNQEELAELAGVSQRSMQAYETGEVIPYRKMREIAQVLQVSPTWILHGEEEEADGEVLELKRQIENLSKLIRTMSKKLDRISP